MTRPWAQRTGLPSTDMVVTAQPSSGKADVQKANTSHGPTASSSSMPSKQ